jgi:hypothetical protein
MSNKRLHHKVIAGILWHKHSLFKSCCANIFIGEVHTGFWWGNLLERDHLEDLGIDGRIISRWVFKKWDGEGWTGLMWLSVGTGSRLL